MNPFHLCMFPFIPYLGRICAFCIEVESLIGYKLLPVSVFLFNACFLLHDAQCTGEGWIMVDVCSDEVWVCGCTSMNPFHLCMYNVSIHPLFG